MILQELNRYYERLLADPERDVPARHWSVEKAAWELKLSRDGRLLGAYQLTTGTGKELRRFVSLRRLTDCSMMPSTFMAFSVSR